MRKKSPIQDNQLIDVLEVKLLERHTSIFEPSDAQLYPCTAFCVPFSFKNHSGTSVE